MISSDHGVRSIFAHLFGINNSIVVEKYGRLSGAVFKVAMNGTSCWADYRDVFFLYKCVLNNTSATDKKLFQRIRKFSSNKLEQRRGILTNYYIDSDIFDKIGFFRVVKSHSSNMGVCANYHTLN